MTGLKVRVFVECSATGADYSVDRTNKNPPGRNRQCVGFISFCYTENSDIWKHCSTYNSMWCFTDFILLFIGIILKPIFFPILGYALDALARRHLWNVGLQYMHGTGHGIGSYLNVHEGKKIKQPAKSDSFSFQSYYESHRISSLHFISLVYIL